MTNINEDLRTDYARKMGVVVTSIPIGAPVERHTVCGDIVERHENDRPVCKSCGTIKRTAIEVS